MKRERSKGGRNTGASGKRQDSGKKRSGWVKPDGTPLRNRKGEYFPDEEINRKRSGKKRYADMDPRSDGDKVNPKRYREEKSDGGSFKKTSERISGEYPSTDKRFTKKPDYKTRSSESHNDRRERSEDTSRSFGRDGRFEKRGERKSSEGKFFQKGKGRFDKDRSGRKQERPFRPKSSVQEGAIRLNRFIANAGICSRREADDLISAGVISINGVVVSELGTKVQPGDVVKFHDRVLKTERMVYVLLNKPKDFITTTDDPQERKTVMNLVKDACRERIFPVGRLDRNTTGLLLLTNDGELTKRLTHPSGNIKKIYQVELDKNISPAEMEKLRDGVELEDGVIHVDEIAYSVPGFKNVIGVELHSGKNRVVRRMFESIGYNVKKLDRTVFAGLTKKDLPRGRWRFLTEMELNMLKMMTGKKS